MTRPRKADLAPCARPDPHAKDRDIAEEFDGLFEATFQEEGFLGLQRRIKRAFRKVAAVHRKAVYREGWIA